LEISREDTLVRTPALYHFTCDHGHAGITTTRRLLNLASQARGRTIHVPPWMMNVVWLTDLAAPDALGLGLTSRTLSCDRTRYRWTVVSPRDPLIVPWAEFRDRTAPDRWEELESAEGAAPGHWWVGVGFVAVRGGRRVV
jgi:hypothetical protein